MSDILDQARLVNVKKRGGAITKFHPYKINWVLHCLNTDDDTTKNVKNAIVNLALNAKDKTVNASDIFDTFKKNLPENLAQKYQDFHNQEIEDFKKATDPTYKMNQFFNHDRDVVNENANKDARVYNTQRDLLAGAASRAIGLKMLPDIVAKAHLRGDIHWHDLDYSPVLTETNCSLPDFKDMLANGFKVGNAWMSSPKSIEIAVQLISTAISAIGGLQYGGQSINRADELLAPYAKLNYDKHLREAEKWLPAEKQVAFAKERTKKDIYNAMQSLEYNINTAFTTQGQTPFVTVNFGLGKSWIEKEIQKDILKIRLEGLGKEKRTAVFPKLVFTLKRGLNLNPGDPNYDIKQLAIRCSTHRMYPDVLMYDKIKEITGSYKSPMGCVDGQEVIDYILNGKHYTEGFHRLWNRASQIENPQKHGISQFIPLNNFKILDKNNQYTKAFGVIKNPDQGNWIRIKMTNGRTITVTNDHPLEVKGKGRTPTYKLEIGDKIPVINNIPYHSNVIKSNKKDLSLAWLNGLLLCDSSFVNNIRISLGLDETDIAAKSQIILNNLYPKANTRLIKQQRNRKGNYLDIVVTGNHSKARCIKLQKLFDGQRKINRHIPSYIFNAPKDIKESFFAGMIDADGYIKPHGQIQIGSTNKELALEQMALLHSLGIYARVYLNQFSKRSSKIRYRIEAKITPGIYNKIVSKKKHNKLISFGRPFKKNYAKIVSIEKLGSLNKPSYDVTTASDTFVVSGLLSHNCRSFLQAWTNPKTGQDEEDGRMNLGVVTVNLPRITLEAHGNKKLFWEIFKERMHIVHLALKYRIARCKQAKPDSAPLLFEYGGFGKRLKPTDSVDKVFKNSRATVSLGYIGIYETLIPFYGPNHEHNKEAHDFGVSIVKALHNYCKKWEDEEGYHYSLYSTPAEKLCDTFAKDDIKKFGKIPNITAKEYYQNSFHYDVRKKPTPFEKLEYEQDFPYFASGGFIHYCEYPNMRQNPAALEAVWDWAYDHVGYLGTNTPIDQCFKCGFKGQFGMSSKGFYCPKCHNRDPRTYDVVKRTCGYLGNPGVRGWNHGKMLEMMNRKKHMSSDMVKNVASFENVKHVDDRSNITSQLDNNNHL